MTFVIVLVVVRILFLSGCYLFAFGVNLEVKGLETAKEVVRNPLFSGLFMILGALCMVFSLWVLPFLRQALS